MTVRSACVSGRQRQVRDDRAFYGGASCGMPALAKLAGVPLDRLFVDADAIVEAWRVGGDRARELFGPRVTVPVAPRAPGISYGHLNTLGVALEFPTDSEVGCARGMHATLAEGVNELRRRRDDDVTQQGLFPRYLELHDTLRQLVTGVDIDFAGYGWQGPITTASLLRGDDFYYDLFDQPAFLGEYLALLTESIVRYAQTCRRINGQAERGESASMTDDLSSMISPRFWPKFVLPYMHQYYEGLTAHRRYAHIENLVADHLEFLDDLALDRYDPSVSPKLTPALIRDGCTVPFDWRLNAMQIREFACDEIERFVFNAAAEGAERSLFYVEPVMCEASYVPKIHAFIDAVDEVEKLLAAGCAREGLRGG